MPWAHRPNKMLRRPIKFRVTPRPPEIHIPLVPPDISTWSFAFINAKHVYIPKTLFSLAWF